MFIMNDFVIVIVIVIINCNYQCQLINF